MKTFVLILFLFFFSVKLHGQNQFYSKITTSYTLANNSVYSIAMNAKGDKWFGLLNAASYVSGNTWATKDFLSGVPGYDANVRVAVDSKGTAWIMGVNSVLRKHDASGWSDGPVYRASCITIDAADNAWFGTGSGLVKFDGVSSTAYTTSSGLVNNSVTAISIDAVGTAWIGTGGGLSKFDGTNWTNYTTANGLPNNNITALAVDKNYHAWIASSSGVTQFDGTTWTTYTMSDGLASNTVNAIAVDGNNFKWFATPNGVSKYDGTTWTTFTTADGLANNTVNDIDVDSDGRIWFATLGGVSIFDGISWSKITYSGRGLLSFPTSIVADKDGTTWFGSGAGAMRFNDTTWTHYTTTEGLVNNVVLSVAIDANGNKWFGTTGGASKFDGANWTSYTTADGLVNNYINTVIIDASGNKWFGTQGGVSKFNGTTWTNYTTADSLINNDVRAIAVDRDRSVWFATGGGISKYDGKKWVSFTKANGLPDIGLSVYNKITSMAIDDSNVKWFGTSNGLLFKYDDNAWTIIHNYNLPQLSTFITKDAFGNIWDGSGHGALNIATGENVCCFYSNYDGSQVSLIGLDNFGNLWIEIDIGIYKVPRCKQVPSAPTITANIDGTLSSSVSTGNRWYLNNTMILGEINSTITPVHPGSYYSIVSSNGCTSKRSNEITAVGTSTNNSIPPDVVTAVNDTAIETSAFFVWPNPTKGILNVRLIKPSSCDFDINIYNSVGGVIGRALKKRKSEADFEIDLSNQQSGLYIIRLNPDSTSISIKVIKN